MNWPDNNKAIKYLSKAVNTGNATPLQMVYLARALIDVEKLDNAENLLLLLITIAITVTIAIAINMNTRVPSFYVENAGKVLFKGPK